MRERLKWVAIAVLMAAVGAVLQWWHTGSSFEPELGLHIAGAPAGWVVIAFYVLSAALFLFLARRAPVQEPREGRVSHWDLAFAAKGNYLYLTLAVLAGLLTLAGAVFLFREAGQLMAARKAGGEGESAVLQVALAVCAVPGAVGMVLPARSAFRMEGRGRESVLLLLPPLFSCVWLLEAYRANAADPVRWNYVPLLVSVGLGVVLQLECAGLSFSGERHPRRMLWLAAMTAAATGAALGGRPEIPMLLLLGGQLLNSLAALWVMPENFCRPPRAEGFGLRARRLAGLPLEEPAGGADEMDPEDGEASDAPDLNEMEDTTDGQ